MGPKPRAAQQHQEKDGDHHGLGRQRGKNEVPLHPQQEGTETIHTTKRGSPRSSTPSIA